jgi:hypothetical protein
MEWAQRDVANRHRRERAHAVLAIEGSDLTWCQDRTLSVRRYRPCSTLPLEAAMDRNSKHLESRAQNRVPARLVTWTSPAGAGRSSSVHISTDRYGRCGALSEMAPHSGDVTLRPSAFISWRSSEASMANASLATPQVWLPRTTEGSVPHRDTHIRQEDAPDGPGIDAQRPDSMPRAEDDAATRAQSPEFHDRPGSGKNTADRQKYF